MNAKSILPAQLRPTPLDTAVLRFLFDAHPMPVFTETIARAIFTRAGGVAKTASGRCWRTLDGLRRDGLVKATASATIAGRPPLAWHLTESTIEWLVSSGRVDLADWKRKPRQHKSLASLIAREHEHHVHAVRAEVEHAARVTPGLSLEYVSYAERNAESVVDPATGEVLSVEPDLVVVLGVDGARLLLLVEVQGTAPRLKEVSAKVRAFRLYLSGAEAMRRYDVQGVRVVFVTFSDDPQGGEDHAWNVMETILGEGQLLKVSFVAPLSAVLREGLLSPIFVTPHRYQEALRAAPGALRDRLYEARHSSNAVRAARDAFVAAAVVHEVLIPVAKGAAHD